jgi:hypothetical protein
LARDRPGEGLQGDFPLESQRVLWEHYLFIRQFVEGVGMDLNTVIFWVAVGAAFFLLTCIAVIDIAYKDFGGIEKKAIWGFVAMVPFLGPLVYFIFGYRKGRRRTGAGKIPN